MKFNKERLEVMLKNYYDQNTVAKVVSIQINEATTKGDNFGSEMKRATLDVVLKSGKQIKESIIIKELPTSFYAKRVLQNTGLFQKEIMVYRDILPLFEDLMIEFNDFTEIMWPKCLDYKVYDGLVLEDLSKRGYVMGDRTQGLDMEHCLIFVRSLAKFHALSLILKERDLIHVDSVGKHVLLHEDKRQMFKGYYTEALSKLIDAMDQDWGPEWKLLANKLRIEFEPNIMELLSKLFIIDANKFNVLCHGDCWVNNMLFKYGLDGVTPISLKFVDFQLTFYNSPAFDLIFFLVTSLNEHVREHCVDKLIEIYHETLLKQLKLYEYDQKIISLEELHSELKRIELYGFILSISLLPFIKIKDKQSMPDIEELLMNAEEGIKNNFTFNPFVHSPPSYINIIKKATKNVVQNFTTFKEEKN